MCAVLFQVLFHSGFGFSVRSLTRLYFEILSVVETDGIFK